jgi:hypothetical protein
MCVKIRLLIQSVRQKATGSWAVRLGFARFLAVLGVAATVAACSTATETTTATAYDAGCMAERADIVDGIDWDGVQPNKVTVVNGEIRPMVMYFEEGRPYMVVVRNADRVDHNLWSPAFFKEGIAIDSVQFGDKAPTKGCVNGVRIKSRSTVTLRFVPVWEGRYELYNSGTFLHGTTGPDAVVNIIQPRIGIASK